jgi:hypothetical protein
MIPRRRLLPLLIVAILALDVSASQAQATPHLQLIMIGHGQGPYYAPAGQTTQVKIEILNLWPDNVYLIRGEVYLDPNLNGKWELVHSESMENFHLSYLQSAIWTFDLPIPPTIRAPNATNGVPQVFLLIRTVYSTVNGMQHTEQAQFALNVPGAIVGKTDYSTWLSAGVVVAILVLCVLVYRHMSKRKAAQ